MNFRLEQKMFTTQMASEGLAVQVSDFVIECKIGTDCIVTGCPQNKKI